MLAELHIKLNKQTIVFNTQTAEDADQDSGLQPGRDVPPLDLKSNFKALRPAREEIEPPQDNPIRASLMQAAKASGGAFDFSLRSPGPVYCGGPPAGAVGTAGGTAGKLVAPALGARLGYAPEFLWAASASWNEESPLPARRYVAPKKDDPTRGTLEE